MDYSERKKLAREIAREQRQYEASCRAEAARAKERAAKKAIEPKRMSWWWVLLAFWLFFPVAIYLVVKKIRTEKAYKASNAKVLKGIGWTLIAISILGLFSDGSELFVFWIICGIVCLWNGKKCKEYGMSVEKLWTMVNSTPTGAIDTYATECQLSHEDVCEILQEWIRTKKLFDVHVDRSGKNLESTLKTYTVECPNCGGAVTITSDNNICEYCGISITTVEQDKRGA